MNLLEKTRKINGMLQKSEGPVNFTDMAETLRDAIDGKHICCKPPR